MYESGNKKTYYLTTVYQEEYGNVKYGLNYWRTYEIHKDTIKAIIYMKYFGKYFKRSQLRQTYFQGIIKNRDTISGWQMSPHYPEIAVTFDMNKYAFEYLKTPRDLFFKEMPAKVLIDSSKAWVNELRDKK